MLKLLCESLVIGRMSCQMFYILSIPKATVSKGYINNFLVSLLPS